MSELVESWPIVHIVLSYWWEYQTTFPASWETYMKVKKQQLEPDMEQQTGSKLGKEYIKAVYCHPAYLTYMQIMEKAKEFQKNIYFCFID